MGFTYTCEVFVACSDPEGSVGGPVSEYHALWDGVAVDESLESLFLKARRVPALLHHLYGHLSHCKLIPVVHLRSLTEENLFKIRASHCWMFFI